MLRALIQLIVRLPRCTRDGPSAARSSGGSAPKARRCFDVSSGMLVDRSGMEGSSNPPNQRIAGRVRALRSEQCLSPDELSGRCGVSRSTVPLIERGESSPTAVLLEKPAVDLNVSLASPFGARYAVVLCGEVGPWR
jgi:DNA-binding XRE family transcriptional regulator